MIGYVFKWDLFYDFKNLFPTENVIKSKFFIIM